MVPLYVVFDFGQLPGTGQRPGTGRYRSCTVPYPGVDKVKVKVSVEVKVNIRRRLGEETPSASIAKARCRQEEASPR